MIVIDGSTTGNAAIDADFVFPDVVFIDFAPGVLIAPNNNGGPVDPEVKNFIEILAIFK